MSRGPAPKVTQHLLILVEGKPRKKPQPGNLPRPGIEPGPPGFEARRSSRYSTGNRKESPSLKFRLAIGNCQSWRHATDAMTGSETSLLCGGLRQLKEEEYQLRTAYQPVQDPGYPGRTVSSWQLTTN
ncbi:hypothetical protein ANN_10311 [Periplaneta americana]|uniref:Uncharacterized protein n=1 Tax=Periplaneta americana TaxID=6978 RepID=A0ABQ8TQJ6_PERAM|nr:hypothetical protein ANN_10311 [Periplaneta americana]